MRLFFVHDRFGAFGGAEVNAALCAAALRRRGHELAIAHGPATARSESDWRALFQHCYPLEDRNSGADVSRAIQEFLPDAIYVHKMADLSVLASLAGSSVPVVRMVHDHDLYCLRSYKYFPLTRTICTRAAGLCCVVPCGATIARSRNNGFPVRWKSYLAKKTEIHLNRRFQRMIVASDYMRQELARNGFDPERIEIHAPVPGPEQSMTSGSFNDRNVIVYAGQIIRGKGVDVLIEALARVRTAFQCLVFGDGGYRHHCERLCRRLGLEGKVRFCGYVPPDELRSHYAQATLSVVSSVWPEPFGAVGLEAMRQGLPVVAFDAGGIREWLVDGMNGFLVPWMDRERFAARVEQLLEDKELAHRMGEQGRQFAREKFGFEQYIAGLEDMFARVIREFQTI